MYASEQVDQTTEDCCTPETTAAPYVQPVDTLESKEYWYNSNGFARSVTTLVLAPIVLSTIWFGESQGIALLCGFCVSIVRI